MRFLGFGGLLGYLPARNLIFRVQEFADLNASMFPIVQGYQKGPIVNITAPSKKVILILPIYSLMQGRGSNREVPAYLQGLHPAPMPAARKWAVAGQACNMGVAENRRFHPIWGIEGVPLFWEYRIPR